MGRSISYKYGVEVRTNGGWGMTPMAWKTKEYGRATGQNLKKMIDTMNQSFLTGGVNDSVTKQYGTEAKVVKAWLKDGLDVVAIYVINSNGTNAVIEGAALGLVK